jgi:hypothetical protein
VLGKEYGEINAVILSVEEPQPNEIDVWYDNNEENIIKNIK